MKKEILPVHIGFIMDGNRRWGKMHSLTRNPIEGTKAGRDVLYRLVELCGKKGIKHITAYAFSTENWRRSEVEVNYLMNLLRDSIAGLVNEAKEKSIRLKFVGRLTDFPEDVQKSIAEAESQTERGGNLTLNLAVSYGGKAEVVDAAKRMVAEGFKPEEITEEKFDEYVYESGQPDLDLIIRTGGVKRLSGFMLWQSTYSEFYFTDTLWPEFNEVELEKALEYFAQVKRNFGK